VKTLKGHSKLICSLAINDNTGDIITCDGTQVIVWDVNGDLIISQNLSQFDNQKDDEVLKCIPLEGRPSQVFDGKLFFTGHNSGTVRIWNKVFNSEIGGWKLEMVRLLEPVYDIPVTHLYISNDYKFLISSDNLGRSTWWMLPDGSGTELHYFNGDNCQQCNTKINMLARKSNCRACGGPFCGQCLFVVPEKNFKLCGSCYKFYSVCLK
jgi:WD40 repeat protein